MELPLGLGMALAQNPAAMQAFAALTDAQKQSVIDGTHAVRSRTEMRQYVQRRLGTANPPTSAPHSPPDVF